MTRKLPTISGGSGPRFVRHTGIAACIEVRDEAGDVLIPDTMFEHAGDASILIAAELFETPAIETTLVRLHARGVRAVLAPGFETRFYQRCVSSLLLPLPLVEEAVDELAERVASRSGVELTVDLDRQLIEAPDREPLPFHVDARVRTKLLLGLTDEEEMLRHVGDAAALRNEDRRRRPWLYGPS